MIFVLDASAAIELVLKRPAAPEIQEALHGANYIITPDLLIWRYPMQSGNYLQLQGCNSADRNSRRCSGIARRERAIKGSLPRGVRFQHAETASSVRKSLRYYSKTQRCSTSHC